MSNIVAKGFNEPSRTLGQVDTEALAKVAAASADVSVIVDRKGKVLDVAFSGHDFEVEGHEHWIGQQLADTVTLESKPKVTEMLAEVSKGHPAGWRQISYASPSGDDDVPILYTAVQVGSKGRIIVLGRELRSIAELQQRLMSAQQSVEQEYARVRQLETRYKMLFQIANEGVIIVDAATMKIVELNPTAKNILGRTKKNLEGSAFVRCFEASSEKAVQTLLSDVRARGDTLETNVRVKGRNESCGMTAVLLRQGGDMLFLVRLLVEPQHSISGDVTLSDTALKGFVEKLPDGFVVASSSGTILSANTAFLEMVRAATEEQVKGVSLEQFIGRQGMDLKLLLAALRDHGSVRRFETTLRSTLGTIEEVEISAAAGANAGQSSFGLTIRNAHKVVLPKPDSQSPFGRSVDEMTKLVGRVPMKDLVRETTDMIERLCIEAALELTQDNRASAAEMLGLSRQSLYTKLHRYGLQDDEMES